jgi:hypothetical protein
MTTVIATHGVGDMATWLAGGADRQELFTVFCSSYRIFRHADRDEVSIVLEGVDLEKMKATLDSPEASAAKAKHSVMEPVDIFIEIENGT